ncbi:MAG: hypothetical protein HN878_03055, partial [Candidatus Diapherotrites archaeon]|nr:hypothetical protein [Candidatus Diapherotrites archaeon]
MGIYSFFEDKWYGVIGAIDHIIPITKLTDRLDAHFPSFLVFLLIIFILLIGFIFLFSGNFIGLTQTYDAEITVVSKIGLPLSGVSVNLSSECGNDFEEVNGITNSEGKVNLTICNSIQNINLSKKGYKTYQNEIDLEIDKIFKLSAASSQVKNLTVLVKDNQDAMLTNASIEFVCDGNTTSFDNQPTSGFFINISSACALSQVRAIAPGYEEKTKTLAGEERIIMKLETQMLEGKVIFETKTQTKEEGLVEIRITDSKNNSFTEITDASGTKEATFPSGDYTYNAFSKKGEVVNGSFSVLTNSTERVEILFNDNVVESKKVLYLEIVDELDNPITNAKVSMYKDGNSLASRNTNTLGKTSPITINHELLPAGTTFSAVIKASGYETKLTPINLVDKGEDAQKITLRQSIAKLKVNHIDDLGEVVKGAFATLYYKGFNEVFDSKT